MKARGLVRMIVDRGGLIVPHHPSSAAASQQGIVPLVRTGMRLYTHDRRMNALPPKDAQLTANPHAQ